MTENQIGRIAVRFILTALAAVFMAGCAGVGKKIILPPEVPRDYWSEKKQNIPEREKKAVMDALEKVMLKASSGASLESLGISTLKESIVLLDNPKAAVPFIADAIEGKNLWSTKKNELYYWKFRYWCIDMAGYLNDKNFAEMLSSIISSENEKNELRVRSVRTLREIKAKSVLKNLFMETGNSAIREEIARALLSLD
ncbi:hypothetical protein KJ633_07675 [bacterium]|nr:hypothetical protein [bacterium]MBU3956324.1 hypothetical protein [bacterium]MBU4134403.1 hypothetical protein [bacterium]